jgi:hypothetical protein
VIHKRTARFLIHALIQQTVAKHMTVADIVLLLKLILAGVSRLNRVMTCQLVVPIMTVQLDYAMITNVHRVKFGALLAMLVSQSHHVVHHTTTAATA